VQSCIAGYSEIGIYPVRYGILQKP